MESFNKKLFETAEIAKFTPEQVLSYEDSLKYYRDLKNSLDTAFDEGLEEGMIKGIEQGIEKGIEKGALQEKISIAKNLLKNGTPIDIIISVTGLSKEQIESLG